MTLLAIIFFPSMLILPAAAFAAIRLRSGWWGLGVVVVIGVVGLLTSGIQAWKVSQSEHPGFEPLWFMPVMFAAGYGIALLIYLAGWYILAGRGNDAT
jgi:choline-glycine betaine transporter